jgi:hypothetical protein
VHEVADTVPTKVTFRRAVRLCFLAVTFPSWLAKDDTADSQAGGASGKVARAPAFVIRHAFWTSLSLVAGSIGIGYLAGRIASTLCGGPSSGVISALQVSGAGMLLWGTLFVRGWEIQTWSGGTLTERINQWLYRSLYCIGTAVVVSSLAWAG